MNRQHLINSIKQNFMLKRIKAQEEAENFISTLRENQDFDSMYTDLLKKELEYFKASIEEDTLVLRHEIDDLNANINKFLQSKNLTRASIEPKYDCPICNDTGVVGGKICHCLLNELNKQISLSASSQNVFNSFDKCNPAIMNENDKKSAEFLRTWCEKFPIVTKRNINLIGGAGAGKTFLLECVANEMINKGYVVYFKTAFELNELARMYHIGKSYDFVDCLNADILIIDDLGTEPILKNVTKEYLYNLINSRQINNRPTFISSNLSLNNILDRYDERIFSRLANKNTAITIELNSKDKRINK